MSQTPRIRNAARLRARVLIWRLRALPSFLVIGAQRSGTTSLHQYLAQHPQTKSPVRKEIHYFSRNYERGERWYRAHFPFRSKNPTFESTPYYLFHPLAPERASRLLPGIKLIALLRNPVERAFSQYLLNVHRGVEPLSFPEALQAEETRLSRGSARSAMGLEPGTDFQRYSYQARSHYVPQLSRWLEFFPRESLYIDTAERFYEDPQAVLSDIEGFLEIEQWMAPDFRNWSHKSPADRMMPLQARDMLNEAFRSANDDLRSLLGRDPGWQ